MDGWNPVQTFINNPTLRVNCNDFGNARGFLPGSIIMSEYPQNYGEKILSWTDDVNWQMTQDLYFDENRRKNASHCAQRCATV